MDGLKANGTDVTEKGGFGEITNLLGTVLGKYSKWKLYTFFFRLTPRIVGYGFWGHFVGNLVWYLFPTLRKNDIRSIKAMFPGTTTKEAKLLSRRTLILMGYGFFYWLMVQWPNWYPSTMEKYCDLSGLEHLDKALSKNKGVIIASPHLGGPTTIFIALALRGYKINLVSNIDVAGHINLIRKFDNVNIIPIGKGMKKKLIGALQRKEILLLFADFSQRKNMGIEFLGKIAHTPTGVPALAQEMGSPVIPVYTYPINLKKQKIVCMPEMKMIDYPTKKEYLGRNMQRINRLFGELITKKPSTYITERITYATKRLFKKKLKVEYCNSKELAQQAVVFARDCLDSTYELNRDEAYYQNFLEKLELDINKVKTDSNAGKKKSDELKVEWNGLDVEFPLLFNKVLEMCEEKEISTILKTHLKNFNPPQKNEILEAI